MKITFMILNYVTTNVELSFHDNAAGRTHVKDHFKAKRRRLKYFPIHEDPIYWGPCLRAKTLPESIIEAKATLCSSIF